MKTTKIENNFKRDLKALLHKYDAELKVENIGGFANDSIIQVYIPTKYTKDFKVIEDSCSINFYYDIDKDIKLEDKKYKKEFLEWRNKYFDYKPKIYEYQVKKTKKMHTLNEIEKQYEKAMLESPF